MNICDFKRKENNKKMMKTVSSVSVKSNMSVNIWTVKLTKNTRNNYTSISWTRNKPSSGRATPTTISNMTVNARISSVIPTSATNKF